MLDHSGSFGWSTGEVPSTSARTRTGKSTETSEQLWKKTMMQPPVGVLYFHLVVEGQRAHPEPQGLESRYGCVCFFLALPPFCAKTGGSGGPFWNQDPAKPPENMFFAFGVGG